MPTNNSPPPPSTSIITTFKAIADESRLKIVAHLTSGPTSVTELAELTGLRPPTVSHHLSILDSAGLVSFEQRGTTRLYSFIPEGLAEARRSLTEEQGLSSFADDDSLEAWEKKVLETFCDGETITQIPASEKKRLVLVRWIAGKLKPVSTTRSPKSTRSSNTTMWTRRISGERWSTTRS